MDLATLAAREEIRDAIARYARYADTGRFEELASLFAEDGRLEIVDGATLHGRPAIREFLEGTRKSLASKGSPVPLRHHVSSVVVEVEGAWVAEAWSYFLVVTDRGPDHWGRYRDHWVRAAGRWQIRHRRVHVEGRAPGSRVGER